MVEKVMRNQQSIQKMTPLDSGARLHHIDSLRGFALLGILLVNMLSFQYGTIGFKYIFPGLTSPDQSTFLMIEWLFQGSFYPIFSMLFGFGTVLMWERAQEKDRPYNLLNFRRLLILLSIGFIHLYFVWDGDILLTYAITGFIFIFFIKRKPKTLLIWALILAFLINAPGLIAGDSDSEFNFQKYIQSENQVLSEGNYGEIVTHRFTTNPFDKIDFGFSLDSIEQQIMVYIITAIGYLTMIAQTTMLFLFGGYIAKKRWLHNLTDNKTFIMRAMIPALLVGLSLKGGMAFTDNIFLDYFGYILGGPILAFGYIAGFSLLFLKLGTTPVFRGFAYVGRMALTNYLMQSIIMTSLFYGYGLGLFGQLGTFVGTFLASALFIIQVFVSRWWLKRYKFGPMEWVWRSGTYLYPQSMKK